MLESLRWEEIFSSFAEWSTNERWRNTRRKPRRLVERVGICRGHWILLRKSERRFVCAFFDSKRFSDSVEIVQGKTVEVGRAYFETDKRRYTILDAPGHKNFVPSMISGAAQADVAVLVISARKGEFETGFEKGGQTREHAMLVKTAGVSKLIVVVNKMDDPTVNWDKERFVALSFLLSCY